MAITAAVRLLATEGMPAVHQFQLEAILNRIEAEAEAGTPPTWEHFPIWFLTAVMRVRESV